MVVNFSSAGVVPNGTLGQSSAMLSDMVMHDEVTSRLVWVYQYAAFRTFFNDYPEFCLY